MKDLFGIPMDTIMVVLVALFAVSLLTFVVIFLSNRIMFRMGLRNIGRRRTQSSLVVAGLMLATVIITAAFATGDTLDYSITAVTYDNLQRTDLSLHHFRSASAVELSADTAGSYYAPETVVPALREAFRGDPDIEGFVPFLYEHLPVLNPRTNLAEPDVVLSGFDAPELDRFGGLRLAGGGRADIASLGTDHVFVNETTADKIDARAGDRITLFAQGQAQVYTVAGVVKDERASGALDFGGPKIPGIAIQLPALQSLVGRPAQINDVNVVLFGDSRSSMKRSDSAAARLEAFVDDDPAKTKAGLSGLSFKVEKNKQDAVEAAQLVGNVFTTIFIVLGLFSIAAGVMLIFTLFVMLAAERRTEMGIARAIGAERIHLVQAFVSEGIVYDIVAGLVGVALGVAVAAFLIVGGVRMVAGEAMSFISPHVTARTLVVSFCLGAVLTFITVAVSAFRISQLNIVAAVRGQSEEGLASERRRRTSWRWVLLGVPALLILPLGIYWILRKGFGMPWAWIVGPVGIIAGVQLIVLGEWQQLMFPVTLGVSLLPLSIATMARYYRAPARPTWTAAGAFITVYWLMPFGVLDVIFGELDGSMEMFVLSGIMVVTGMTLVIVYNARLITSIYASGQGAHAYRALQVLLATAGLLVLAGVLTGDRGRGLGQLFYLVAGFVAIFAALSVVSVRFPRFAPALKMAVAYPLASRFRTGMTIAMFSLVVFSVTVMGVINGSFLQMFSSNEGRGGWDIEVTTNRNNPVADVREALREGAVDTSAIAVEGRRTTFDKFREVRQPGASDSWTSYPVHAADDAYYARNEMKLQSRAVGYESDRDVFEALRTTPGLAVIDYFPMSPPNPFGGGEFDFHVSGVKVTDNRFAPFLLEFRDPATGLTGSVTVIGVISEKVLTNIVFGVFTNEQTYTPVFGKPDYGVHYLRLQPGSDAKATAKAIKAALVTQGVQAVSIQEQIDDTLAQSRGFLRIFQAFMGLGLFIGIASLGVIALRSVVERRQQIGMLRAIGYQRGTVALSFILESAFVAFMGILSGIVGAAILSWNILSEPQFTGGGEDVAFFLPWAEIISYGVLAFLFAMLMTWWPSRRAASVPIAEALRYE